MTATAFIPTLSYTDLTSKGWKVKSSNESTVGEGDILHFFEEQGIKWIEITGLGNPWAANCSFNAFFSSVSGTTNGRSFTISHKTLDGVESLTCLIDPRTHRVNRGTSWTAEEGGG